MYLLLVALLSPEDFGIVAVASLLIFTLQNLIDGGFAEAIIQRKQVSERMLSTAFWTSVAIAAVLTVSLIALAGWVTGLFKTDQPQTLSLILTVMAAIFPLSALQSVPLAIMRREMKFKPLAIRTMIGTALGAIVGLTSALLGAGVWALVAQLLVTNITNCLALWRVCPWRPSFLFDTDELSSLLKFSGSIVGIRALDVANSRLEQFLIGGFLGVVALGLYAVGVRIVTMLLQMMYATIGATTLRAFSVVQDDPPRIQSAFLDGVGLVQLAAMPAFAGLAILAPEIISLFGPQWSDATVILQITCLIGVTRAAAYFSSSLLTALGKPHLRLVIGIISAALNVVAFFIGMQWGIEGVAIAVAIRVLLISPVMLLVCRHFIQFRLTSYASRFVPPAIGSLVMAGGILALRAWLPDSLHNAAVIAIQIVVAVPVYALVVSMVAPSAAVTLLDTVDQASPAGKRITASARRIVGFFAWSHTNKRHA